MVEGIQPLREMLEETHNRPLAEMRAKARALRKAHRHAVNSAARLAGRASGVVPDNDSSDNLDDQQIEKARQHVLKHYGTAEAVSSFVDEAGRVFDCIPIEQQPTLQSRPETVSKPPDNTPSTGDPDVPHVPPAGVDQFGNAVQRPGGTIAVMRITADMLLRLGTLEEVDGKGRRGIDSPLVPRADIVHKYGYMRQTVANRGMSSTFNVHSVPVDPGQGFSLSQQWIMGGSYATDDLQSIEPTIEIYPYVYNTQSPVLGIYFTVDTYKPGTSGRVVFVPGFIQTNSNWILGGTVGPTSSTNGPQYTLQYSTYLSGGRWWLFLQGTQPSNALGYFPISHFQEYPAGTPRPGTLVNGAAYFDCGGETTPSLDQTYHPAMGVGGFASEGWQKAGYHRNIRYFTMNGLAVHAAGTVDQPTPSQYTAQLNSYAAPWNRTLWFGGPGGPY